MLITLIIILLLIGAAVVGSIYSGFLVFYSNFSESGNYHRAYYTAISALERGELVVKQRSPGYVGSGGFKYGIGTGSVGNTTGGSDGNLSGFSYLGDNADISTVFWTVNSRTDRIPASGEGNVEGMLAGTGSDNYNMMNYEDAEIFLLYIDNSTGKPYEKVDCGNNWDASYCENSEPSKIGGEIRLPILLRADKGFGNLNENNPLVGQNEGSNVPKDDPIVDWQIRGYYSGNRVPFTIYSTSKLNGKNIEKRKDSVFRESDINGGLNFSFNTNWYPFPTTSYRGNDLTGWTIVSQKEGEINNDASHHNKFNYVFSNSKFSNVQLRFSLLNLLKGFNNSGGSGKVYPFLEYYVDFGKDVPDKYYTISADGNYADYQVSIIIQKPTAKESILGSFTSIF